MQMCRTHSGPTHNEVSSRRGRALKWAYQIVKGQPLYTVKVRALATAARARARMGEAAFMSSPSAEGLNDGNWRARLLRNNDILRPLFIPLSLL